MNVLRGLALLLVLQAAGELLRHGLALPIPGPVLGLVLLMLALRLPWVREPVAAVAEVLLAQLSLLFVPVGVGVITHLPLLSRHGAGAAGAAEFPAHAAAVSQAGWNEDHRGQAS